MAETVINQNQIGSQVYTGFNEYSYIKFKNSFPAPTTSFEFGTRVQTVYLGTGYPFFCICGNSSDQIGQGGMFFRTFEDGYYRVWWINQSKTGWCGNLDGNTRMDLLTYPGQIGRWQYIKLTKDSPSSNLVVKKSFNGQNWDLVTELSTGGEFLSSPDEFRIGCSGGQITYARGFIDMAHTYVKVDGQLVLDGSDRNQYILVGDVIAL